MKLSGRSGRISSNINDLTKFEENILSNQFFFEQRRGKLDIRSISQVDIERIIVTTDIDSIQNLLENLTFCKLELNDINNLGDPLVLKLFRLCQLTIEYLLYSQEEILEKLTNLATKYSNLKVSIKKKNKQIVELEESTLQWKKQAESKQKKVEVLESLLRQASNNITIPESIMNQMNTIYEPRHYETWKSPNTAEINNDEIFELRSKLQETKSDISTVIEMLSTRNNEIEALKLMILQQQENNQSISPSKEQLTPDPLAITTSEISDLRRNVDQTNVAIMQLQNILLQQNQEKVKDRPNISYAEELIIGSLETDNLEIYEQELSKFKTVLRNQTEEIEFLKTQMMSSSKYETSTSTILLKNDDSKRVEDIVETNLVNLHQVDNADVDSTLSAKIIEVPPVIPTEMNSMCKDISVFFDLEFNPCLRNYQLSQVEVKLNRKDAENMSLDDIIFNIRRSIAHQLSLPLSIVALEYEAIIVTLGIDIPELSTFEVIDFANVAKDGKLKIVVKDSKGVENSKVAVLVAEWESKHGGIFTSIGSSTDSILGDIKKWSNLMKTENDDVVKVGESIDNSSFMISNDNIRASYDDSSNSQINFEREKYDAVPVTTSLEVEEIEENSIAIDEVLPSNLLLQVNQHDYSADSKDISDNIHLPLATHQIDTKEVIRKSSVTNVSQSFDEMYSSSDFESTVGVDWNRTIDSESDLVSFGNPNSAVIKKIADRYEKEVSNEAKSNFNLDATTTSPFGTLEESSLKSDESLFISQQDSLELSTSGFNK